MISLLSPRFNIDASGGEIDLQITPSTLLDILALKVDKDSSIRGLDLGCQKRLEITRKSIEDGTIHQLDLGCIMRLVDSRESLLGLFAYGHATDDFSYLASELLEVANPSSATKSNISLISQAFEEYSTNSTLNITSFLENRKKMIFMDKLTIELRGDSKKHHLFMVHGINEDLNIKVLNVTLSAHIEDDLKWGEILRELKTSGLCDPGVVITIPNQDLIWAFKEVYPNGQILKDYTYDSAGEKTLLVALTKERLQEFFNTLEHQ